MAEDEPSTPPEAERRRTRREERALRARESQFRQMPKDALKILITLVIIAGVVGAVIYVPKLLPDQVKHKPHEHYAFKMYKWHEVDGNFTYLEINFESPTFFDYPNGGDINGHLHLSGGESTGAVQYIIHSEGGAARTSGIRLDAFFAGIEVDMNSDSIRLHRQYHGGEVLKNDADREWKLYVDACADGAGNWRDETKFGHYTPIHHDRMLLIFQKRNHTLADMANQLDTVPKHDDLDAALRETC